MAARQEAAPGGSFDRNSRWSATSFTSITAPLSWSLGTCINLKRLCIGSRHAPQGGAENVSTAIFEPAAPWELSPVPWGGYGKVRVCAYFNACTSANGNALFAAVALLFRAPNGQLDLPTSNHVKWHLPHFGWAQFATVIISCANVVKAHWFSARHLDPESLVRKSCTWNYVLQQMYLEPKWLRSVWNHHLVEYFPCLFWSGACQLSPQNTQQTPFPIPNTNLAWQFMPDFNTNIWGKRWCIRAKCQKNMNQCLSM